MHKNTQPSTKPVPTTNNVLMRVYNLHQLSGYKFRKPNTYWSHNLPSSNLQPPPWRRDGWITLWLFNIAMENHHF